jgi:AcrR family transcriptional regulator
MSSETKAEWREAKRRAARTAIVEAAWRLVHVDGLPALAMRELAAEAGVTTPTVYAYFDSKNAIYDAMFGQAANDFADRMDEPYGAADPLAVLAESMRRFLEFCTSDPPRYQLLFQRLLPGFEPSAESFEPAIRALDTTRERLADAGIHDPHHLDLWTALCTGLADQQIANDPGGTRWIDLVDDAVAMYLAHCAPSARTPSTRSRRARPR